MREVQCAYMYICVHAGVTMIRWQSQKWCIPVHYSLFLLIFGFFSYCYTHKKLGEDKIVFFDSCVCIVYCTCRYCVLLNYVTYMCTMKHQPLVVLKQYRFERYKRSNLLNTFNGDLGFTCTCMFLYHSYMCAVAQTDLESSQCSNGSYFSVLSTWSLIVNQH